MAWAVAQDGGSNAATLDYATRGQPETFAISPSGVVIGSYIGPVRPSVLVSMATNLPPRLVGNARART